MQPERSRVEHLHTGQTVNHVDQLSSVVLLGLAVAGAVTVIVLNMLLIG